MKNCRFCGGFNLTKKGSIGEKPRFYCKDCQKHQLKCDGRVKYDDKIKLAATIMFQEGLGFRAIARTLKDIFAVNISYQLIQYWFEKMHIKLKEKIAKDPEKPTTIPILEMDEIFTFVKKKSIKSVFGLLVTETNCVLLRFK